MTYDFVTNQNTTFTVNTSIIMSHPLLQYNGGTNVANSSMQCGGVGRNVCDALTRLGSQPRFLTAIGTDMAGDYITNNCPHMVCIGEIHHVAKQRLFEYTKCYVNILTVMANSPILIFLQYHFLIRDRITEMYNLNRIASI